MAARAGGQPGEVFPHLRDHLGEGVSRLRAGGTGDPRRQRLRLEVMAVRTDDAPPFVGQIRGLWTGTTSIAGA